jgi:hypothetical protein
MAHRVVCIVFGFGLLIGPSWAMAQPFESLSTRAAGMGGAFVAVADDGSAVYWNPGGLASGSFFSLVLDRNLGEGQAPADVRASSRRATLFALGTPPLGLSYYQLRSIDVMPSPSSPSVPGFTSAEVTSLATHHLGVTLVQSLIDGIAIGTTLKFVHGSAGAGTVTGVDLDRLIDDADRLDTEGGNAFDADIGVMAVMGPWRAGLTVRNVAQPGFELPGVETELKLDRMTRAGIAYQINPSVLVAADLDLERVATGLGERRGLAVGGEGRVLPKLFVRGGLNVNVAGDQPSGRATGVSVGASYAVWESFQVDAQATFGEEAAARGWGIAGRVVF